MAACEIYSLDGSIEKLFKSTSATREACDEKAASLVGGELRPVPIQGDSSYTVYGGVAEEFVVQFRLEQISLKAEIANLAREIHGNFAPVTTYHGHLGDTNDRPVFVYTLSRIPGVNCMEFRLANQHGDDSEENKAMRAAFIDDIARYFAASWKSPQTLDPKIKEQLKVDYSRDLELFLEHLPERFHPAIQQCLDSISSIFNLLPTVLLHRDFGLLNIMVDQTSGRLNGVVDWAEAEICPFGQNLCELHEFSSALHRTGSRRLYEDHGALQARFWKVFREEVGNLSPEVMHAIGMARILGCLLSRGFTNRLMHNSPPAPTKEDERGMYSIRLLDGYLIDEKTRFEDLRSYLET